MGAVDADAYGPLTTSPALIWGAHMPKKLVTNTVGRRLTHSRPGVDGELLDLLVAVAAKSRRLTGEVVVGVDGRQRDKARTPSRRAEFDDRRELVAERARVEEHRGCAAKTCDGRADHLDAGGKLCGVGLTGDGAHRRAGFCELVDQRAADVAGCARDKNCVHATKDEAATGKVTCGRV